MDSSIIPHCREPKYKRVFVRFREDIAAEFPIELIGLKIVPGLKDWLIRRTTVSGALATFHDNRTTRPVTCMISTDTIRNIRMYSETYLSISTE